MFLFAGVFSASVSIPPQEYSKEKCVLQSVTFVVLPTMKSYVDREASNDTFLKRDLN